MALSRGVTAATLTELAKPHIHPALLMEADWAGTTLRMHSGIGDLTWNANTFKGVGVLVDDGDGGQDIMALVNLAIPDEGGGIVPATATVHAATTLEALLAQRGLVIRNLPFTAWFALTTEPGGTTLIGDPVELFHGYFDSRDVVMDRNAEGQMHDMILGIGSGPPARSKASITHTYEDQIAKYPGDTAGRHVQNMIKKALNPPIWPEP